jgi:hypothetical protein
MSVVKRGFSSSGPVRGSVSIQEVSTIISLDEFSQRIHLSYLGGIQKSFIESETIQKFSKESELSTREVTMSRTSLCLGEPSSGLVGKG